jgi:hypothetical protein
MQGVIHSQKGNRNMQYASMIHTSPEVGLNHAALVAPEEKKTLPINQWDAVDDQKWEVMPFVIGLAGSNKSTINSAQRKQWEEEQKDDG